MSVTLYPCHTKFTRFRKARNKAYAFYMYAPTLSLRQRENHYRKASFLNLFIHRQTFLFVNSGISAKYRKCFPIRQTLAADFHLKVSNYSCTPVSIPQSTLKPYEKRPSGIPESLSYTARSQPHGKSAAVHHPASTSATKNAQT